MIMTDWMVMRRWNCHRFFLNPPFMAKSVTTCTLIMKWSIARIRIRRRFDGRFFGGNDDDNNDDDNNSYSSSGWIEYAMEVAPVVLRCCGIKHVSRSIDRPTDYVWQDRRPVVRFSDLGYIGNDTTSAMMMMMKRSHLSGLIAMTSVFRWRRPRRQSQQQERSTSNMTNNFHQKKTGDGEKL